MDAAFDHGVPLLDRCFDFESKRGHCGEEVGSVKIKINKKDGGGHQSWDRVEAGTSNGQGAVAEQEEVPG